MKHPSPNGHGWELVDGNCRPVRRTRPALPAHPPTLRLETHEETDEKRWRTRFRAK